MPSGSSETTGFLVVDLARLFRHAFERAVAREGLDLTAGEARTLLHASYADGIRQHALAERMRVEPMTLSNFVDRLQARGLLTREPDPEDRRAKLVRVAPVAEPLVERVRAVASLVREQATQGIAATDVERLQRILQTMRSNLAEPAREQIAGQAA